MDIDRYDKDRIEKILNGFLCPHGFRCYKSGLENLCKAKDIGLEHHILCLEKDPKGCVFAIPFGGGHFCRCPLRVYIAKEMKK